MTPTAALLEELRLLRAMGNVGRAAAARALRSARLGRRPENPGPQAEAAASTYDDDGLKYLIHELDSAVVQRGGRSIFAAKPVGTLSAEAARRLEAWVFETPRRHADATGVKPNDEPVGPERRRVLAGKPLPPLPAKPGRLVAGLTGKLGGYASDRDDER